MIEHIDIRVEGKVQGVFFRQKTQEIAMKFGIKGWVKNKEDGSVYIEAEADKPILEQFIHWCHTGPEKAEVLAVHIEKGTFQNYQGFEIIR